MIENIEHSILSALVRDADYSLKVAPALERDFFHGKEAFIVSGEILEHIEKYKKNPAIHELRSRVGDLASSIPDVVLEKTIKFVDTLEVEKSFDLTWMLDRTDKFIKQRALQNAVRKAVMVLDGTEKKLTEDALPDLVKDALARGLDQPKVYDYFDMAEDRWEKYTRNLKKVKFRSDYFNRITRGGIWGGTLTLLVAGTNVGKSAMLCAFTADFLAQGYNVLYISNEMNEEMISERIDANLLDIAVDDLKSQPKDFFLGQVAKARKSHSGILKIQSYPTRTASVRHFRRLMKDLKEKENFVPDVVILDYLNNCLPATVRIDSNSYERVKAIAEEIRGFSMEFDLPVLSATQTTRGGQSNVNVGIEDVSESHGTSQTADWMWALIRPEELVKTSEILVKQIKNRHSDINYYNKFVVKFDFSRMRLSDARSEALDDNYGITQDNDDDVPIADRTPFHLRSENDHGVFAFG